MAVGQVHGRATGQRAGADEAARVRLRVDRRRDALYRPFDPEPASRQVFTFHRPETLDEWVRASSEWGGVEQARFRQRLRGLPPLDPAGQASLDLFWLRDESLEDTDDLPVPEVIAAEIVEDLEAALAQFAEIAASLSSSEADGV